MCRYGGIEFSSNGGGKYFISKEPPFQPAFVAPAATPESPGADLGVRPSSASRIREREDRNRWCCSPRTAGRRSQSRTMCLSCDPGHKRLQTLNRLELLPTTELLNGTRSNVLGARHR